MKNKCLNIKKISFVLFCALLLVMPLLLTACSNKDDGFVEVYSLEYGFPDSKYISINTLNSKFEITYANEHEITKELYDSAPEEQQIGRLDTNFIIDIDKSNLKQSLTLLNKEVYFRYYNQSTLLFKYYESKITNIKITFIKIKIIDNKSFYLKNLQGETKLISTETYEITYFK